MTNNNNTPNNNNFKLHIREDDYAKTTLTMDKIPINVYKTFKRLCNYKNRSIKDTLTQLIIAYVKVNKHVLPKT